MHFFSTLRCKSRRQNSTSLPNAEQKSSLSLPVELVLYILTLSLDSTPNPSSRQSTLARLSLLCTASNQWIQAQLYAFPLLSRPAQVKLFHRTVSKNAGLGEMVRSLRLDGLSRGGDGDLQGYRRRMTKYLPRILGSCSGLKELELENLVVHSMDELHGADGVTHLTLRNTLLNPRSPRFPPSALFPHVTHLTLHSPQFTPHTSTIFLSHSTFPTLTSLHLNGCILVATCSPSRKLGAFEWSNPGARALLAGLQEVKIGEEGAGARRRGAGWEVERGIVRRCVGAERVVWPARVDEKRVVDV